MPIRSVLLILSFFAQLVWAEGTCSYKNQRNSLGPIRNQGNMGWCYAHTAADLLSYVSKKSEPVEVSPAFLGLLYNYEFTERPYQDDGGTVKRTLLQALEPYPSHHPDFLIGFCAAPIDSLLLPESLGQSIESRIRKLYLMKLIYNNNPTQWMSHAELQSLMDAIKIPRSVLVEVLENSNAIDFPLKLANRVCGSNKRYATEKFRVHQIMQEESRPFRPPTGPLQYVFVKNDLIEVINDQLDNNNIVGIDYSSGFLTDEKLLGRGVFHASPVIGRRWNEATKSCEYLVRNSWGPDCEAPVANSTKRAPKYSKLVSECDDGYLWIKEEILEKVTETVTYISKD